jgi:hypothetical protein
VELSFYIRNLLYNHDVVIIPEFGGLLSKYKPSEINSSDNSITPPSKYIIFDKNLINSDGLLANYIAQQKNITIEDAKLFISEEVTLLNKKLDAEETIMVESIGYISKKDGIVRFEREQDSNFFTGSFGLSKVGYKKTEIKQVKLHHPQNPIHIPERSKKSHLLIYLLLLIAVILGGITIVYVRSPRLADKVLMKLGYAVPQNQTIPKKNNDTLKKDQNDTSRVNDLEKFFDSATDKKRALAIQKESINKPEKLPEGTYYIIAASFNSFERASKFSKQLIKKGIKSEVIQFNQNTFRVSLGEFNNKDQALVEMKKIRSKKETESVWLLSSQTP